jgi:hypothetical protein
MVWVCVSIGAGIPPEPPKVIGAALRDPRRIGLPCGQHRGEEQGAWRMQSGTPGWTGWVRVRDLTDEVIQQMDRAQRAEAAREGWLPEYDREYRLRMRRLDQDRKLSIDR